jgi:CRP-like cAMP-binding protein
MTDRDVAILASSPLFSGIEARELSKALAGLHHSTATFRAGSVVLLAGCSYESLRMLLEGEVAAEMTNDEGKTFVVETLKAPEAVATAVLFAPGRALPVTVIARTEVRLAVLPLDTLLALCSRFRPVLEALLFDMGSRLTFLADRLKALRFATLRERLADWLSRRASLSPRDPETGGAVVRLEVSKERLSALFGVSRPSLSREFGTLRRKGLIAVEGRRILVLDEAGLRALAPR